MTEKQASETTIYTNKNLNRLCLLLLICLFLGIEKHSMHFIHISTSFTVYAMVEF